MWDKLFCLMVGGVFSMGDDIPHTPQGQASAYLGDISYRLEPQQWLEHQFFGLGEVSSLDLYFDEPPYRRVEEADMNCYWSFQDIGLLEVGQWQLQQQEYHHVLCLGDDVCIMVGNVDIIILDVRQLKRQYRKTKDVIGYTHRVVSMNVVMNGPRVVDFSLLGYVLIVDALNVALLDVSDALNPVPVEIMLPHPLRDHLHSAVEVRSHGYAIFINTGRGIHIYTYSFNLEFSYLGLLDSDASFTQMTIENDILYVISSERGLLMYDIGDILYPMQYPLDYDINSQIILAFTIHQNHLITLSNYTSNLTTLSVYQTNFTEKSVQLIPILNGQFEMGQLELQLYTPYIYGTGSTIIVSYGPQITLIQLSKQNLLTHHQQSKHSNQYNLSTSIHLLPNPSNHPYVLYGKVLQVDNNTLQMFQPSTQSYNLVCRAPSATQEYRYLGVMRSDEPCTKITPSPGLEAIILREQQQPQQVQCIYTFQFNMNVQRRGRMFSQTQLVLLGLLVLLILVALFQFVRQRVKSNYVSRTLHRFEQLNNQMQEQQKIRINQQYYNDEFDQGDLL